MAKRALVIGGTGPTGPGIVKGLGERGYEVTILHSGNHEIDFPDQYVNHIHADVHFAETLVPSLEGRTFDVVVAQYGRLRLIADALVGRTDRVIAAGAATAIYAPQGDPRWGRMGKPAWFPASTPHFVSSPDDDKLGYRMVEALERLFARHAEGAYAATYVGYPMNYGPRNPGPVDWSVIRRLRDGRRRLVIADGGIKLESRLQTASACAAILTVVDNPGRADGKRYTVADESHYTLRQRIEYIAGALGVDVELIDMPYDVAWPCHPLWRFQREHRLCDSSQIREELGFQDAGSVEEGLDAEIEWLAANPPDPGGVLEQQVGDPFDYAGEDALIGAWREFEPHFEPLRRSLEPAKHQYMHPKKVGQQWAESVAGLVAGASAAAEGDDT